jgi:hypothetical protein
MQEIQFWSHFLVLLKSNLDVHPGLFVEQMLLLSFTFGCDPIQGVFHEAGLLNKSLCLAPTLGVTKFIIVEDKILVTLCCAT